jgi:ribosome-associated translation inhibitor RaiA
MQIDIQSRGFSLTSEFVSYYRRKLILTLAYCSGHVRQVIVRLSDINGHHGRTQSRCHIRVKLAGLPDVSIEDTEADLYAAIDRAVAQAKRIVVCAVDRQLTPRENIPAFAAYESTRMTDSSQVVRPQYFGPVSHKRT